MPAIQTTVADTHTKARAGLVANGRPYAVETGIASGDTGFGVALVRGAGEREVQIAQGTQDGDHLSTSFVGISCRDGNLRIENADPTVLKDGDPVPVLVHGEIYVTVKAAVAVGADVTFDAAGALSSEAPAAGQSKIPGARWLSAAGAGALARVFIPDYKHI